MRRAGAALLFAAALVTSGVAAGASRVAVVEPENPDATWREATTRLGAELRAAGFEVVSVRRAPGAGARDAVEAPSSAPEPIATIAIQGTGGGAVADVWVADHLSDKTLVKRIEVNDADPSSASITLAIRAVELLRASLLELREPRRAPRPVPPDVARWIEPRPAAAPPPPEGPGGPGIEAAVAVLGSYAGFGVTLGPRVRVSHPAPLGCLARASLFMGLSRPVVTAPSSFASLDQELGSLDLARPFGPFAGGLRPVVSLGIGAYHLHTQASGTGSYPIGGSASTWAFAADAGAGLALPLGAHLALQADLHALFLAPEPAVRLAGFDAGRAGQPALLGALGLALWR
jgi:hypothetical protein